jgi:Domain of unknown function (DUF4281)
MTLNFIFYFCMALALIGWSALALAPLGRAYCIGLARGIALVLAVAYCAQLVLITEPTGGDFSTLAGITLLFSRAGNVMLGWTHYLAFDLFIGSWQVEESARRGISHWLVIPCLVLTLMLGPIGLLLYFVIRTAIAVTASQPTDRLPT